MIFVAAMNRLAKAVIVQSPAYRSNENKEPFRRCFRARSPKMRFDKVTVKQGPLIPRLVAASWRSFWLFRLWFYCPVVYLDVINQAGPEKLPARGPLRPDATDASKERHDGRAQSQPCRSFIDPRTAISYGGCLREHHRLANLYSSRGR